jgi:hypothetical protein
MILDRRSLLAIVPKSSAHRSKSAPEHLHVAWGTPIDWTKSTWMKRVGRQDNNGTFMT